MRKKVVMISAIIGSVTVVGIFLLCMVTQLQNKRAISSCRTVLLEDYDSLVKCTDIYMPVSLTPWNAIGGCGASGSGSVGDGIQWIGNGVHGGLIDLEIMHRTTIRKNFRQLSVTPRFSFKPTWTTDVAVSFPIMSKSGAVQYQANMEEFNRTTGGIGDVTIDAARMIGFSGTYRLQCSLTLPTGQFDIKRGPESNLQFLPVDFQMGGGVYSATVLLSRSFDMEDGFFKVDVSYSHPFNMHLFEKRNPLLDEYFPEYKDRKSNNRFYYRVKPYGESDCGAYLPPSLSLAGYYAYRGETGYVHSFGLFFNAPLGVAWIPEPVVTTYAPFADPGHKAWSGAFIYGLEFSRTKYPLLLSVSLPIHDTPDAAGSFDGPDRESFLDEWIFACGLKTTLF